MSYTNKDICSGPNICKVPWAIIYCKYQGTVWPWKAFWFVLVTWESHNLSYFLYTNTLSLSCSLSHTIYLYPSLSLSLSLFLNLYGWKYFSMHKCFPSDFFALPFDLKLFWYISFCPPQQRFKIEKTRNWHFKSKTFAEGDAFIIMKKCW